MMMALGLSETSESIAAGLLEMSKMWVEGLREYLTISEYSHISRDKGDLRDGDQTHHIAPRF